MTPFRLAIRGLRAAPVFTMTALATLALCLGATLTIFALVDAVLLRPLPYPDASRLVTIYSVYAKLPLPVDGASLTHYFERRGRLPALASLAALDQAASLVGETGATSREPMDASRRSSSPRSAWRRSWAGPSRRPSSPTRPITSRCSRTRTWQRHTPAIRACSTAPCASTASRAASSASSRAASAISRSMRRSTCRCHRRKGERNLAARHSTGKTLVGAAPAGRHPRRGAGADRRARSRPRGRVPGRRRRRRRGLPQRGRAAARPARRDDSSDADPAAGGRARTPRHRRRQPREPVARARDGPHARARHPPGARRGSPRDRAGGRRRNAAGGRRRRAVSASSSPMPAFARS